MRIVNAIGTVTLALCSWIWLPDVWAAQQIYRSDLDTLQQTLMRRLEPLQLTLIDDASTDRFVLIQARHQDGTHMTITLLQTDDGTQVSARSDSPASLALEQRVLADLLAATTVEQ